MKVANLADNLWRQRKDDMTLRDFRDDTESAYTFFRDILQTDLKFPKKLSID